MKPSIVWRDSVDSIPIREGVVAVRLTFATGTLVPGLIGTVNRQRVELANCWALPETFLLTQADAVAVHLLDGVKVWDFLLRFAWMRLRGKINTGETAFVGWNRVFDPLSQMYQRVGPQLYPHAEDGPPGGFAQLWEGSP